MPIYSTKFCSLGKEQEFCLAIGVKVSLDLYFKRAVGGVPSWSKQVAPVSPIIQFNSVVALLIFIAE